MKSLKTLLLTLLAIAATTLPAMAWTVTVPNWQVTPAGPEGTIVYQEWRVWHEEGNFGYNVGGAPAATLEDEVAMFNARSADLFMQNVLYATATGTGGIAYTLPDGFYLRSFDVLIEEGEDGEMTPRDNINGLTHITTTGIDIIIDPNAPPDENDDEIDWTALAANFPIGNAIMAMLAIGATILSIKGTLMMIRRLINSVEGTGGTGQKAEIQSSKEMERKIANRQMADANYAKFLSRPGKQKAKRRRLERIAYNIEMNRKWGRH